MKRTSTEPTLVIPRSDLPPVSTAPGPTIEQLADVERARRDLVETLVPCPAGCVQGMVTVERRARLLDMLDPPAELDEVAELDEPGDAP